MLSRLLLNRFTLDDPDWDMLDCALLEGEDTTEEYGEQEQESVR